MKFSEFPYERINLEQVQRDYERLIDRLKKATSGEEQLKVHEEYYQLSNHVKTMMIIAHIRNDANTADEFYDQERAFLDDVEPMIEDLTNQYQKTLYESKYRAYLEEKLGKVSFKNMELAMRSFHEKLIPLKQEENNLIRQYNKLIASANIPFRGETLNIAMLGKYRVDSDRETRREAWAATGAFFESITEQIDEIYDQMVHNRTKQAELMGYKSYTDMAYDIMGRNCYDKQMVETLREQMKQYFVPYVVKCEKERCKRLGLEHLSFIDNDICFRKGNPKPLEEGDFVLNTTTKMYTEMSPETKEFIEFMVKAELFDLHSRPNKNAGGYMEFIPDYKAPYIYANFNGTYDDVDTMTHEGGHAFQGYLTRNESQEYQNITMETAEVHSMSMEYFAYPWMKDFFGDAVEDYYLVHKTSNESFLPYGCMVDEFQHIVYDHPNMTPKQRKQAWLDLEAIYRPTMNYEDAPFYSEGGYWQRQLHIFNYPFYYIDYVIAEVCALQFKVLMKEDPKKAWEQYLVFCKAGAGDFFTEIVKKAGLKSPFEDGCIQSIVEKL